MKSLHGICVSGCDAFRRGIRLAGVICALGAVFAAVCASASSTMDESNKWAWGASGWINCRPDTTNGASVGEFYCSNYLWSSGTGWIHLGNGNPTNGMQYTNTSSNDYGVNHDGAGNLRGYAWSASIGWVNFEDTGAPKVDLNTGILSGYAWGGSIGWISFTNIQAFAQTDVFDTGTDGDGDAIPDTWERIEAGSLTALGGGTNNFDQDMYTDAEEYTCGTDPQDSNSYLRITAVGSVNGTNSVTWTCDPSRVYRVETNGCLTAADGWGESSLGDITTSSDSNVTRTIPFGSTAFGFFRVKVAPPLYWP